MGLTACATAGASWTDPILSEFDRSCLLPERSEFATAHDDQVRGWARVGENAHSGLKAYTGLVFTMLEDTLGDTALFQKTVNGRDYFLIRYSYDGQYGMTAYNCVVSDFDLDSWKYPEGLMEWLPGRVTMNKMSSSELKGQKAVGMWFTKSHLQPVSKIQLSAVPKNGLDAQTGGFYGTMLQSIRLETTKNSEQEN